MEVGTMLPVFALMLLMLATRGQANYPMMCKMSDEPLMAGAASSSSGANVRSIITRGNIRIFTTDEGVGQWVTITYIWVIQIWRIHMKQPYTEGVIPTNRDLLFLGTLGSITVNPDPTQVIWTSFFTLNGPVFREDIIIPFTDGKAITKTIAVYTLNDTGLEILQLDIYGYSQANWFDGSTGAQTRLKESVVAPYNFNKATNLQVWVPADGYEANSSSSADQWWGMEFEKRFSFWTIGIANYHQREKLQGIHILIGNRMSVGIDMVAEDPENPMKEVFYQEKYENSAVMIAYLDPPQWGSTVLILNRNHTLYIEEVFIWGCHPNEIAPGEDFDLSMSSFFLGSSTNLAITMDGVYKNFTSLDSANTESSRGQWWQVDMLKIYRVAYIMTTAYWVEGDERDTEYVLLSQAPTPASPEQPGWYVVYSRQTGFQMAERIYLDPSQLARHVAVYSQKSSGMKIIEVDIILYGDEEMCDFRSEDQHLREFVHATSSYPGDTVQLTCDSEAWSACGVDCSDQVMCVWDLNDDGAYEAWWNISERQRQLCSEVHVAGCVNSSLQAQLQIPDEQMANKILTSFTGDVVIASTETGAQRCADGYVTYTLPVGSEGRNYVDQEDYFLCTVLSDGVSKHWSRVDDNKQRTACDRIGCQMPTSDDVQYGDHDGLFEKDGAWYLSLHDEITLVFYGVWNVDIQCMEEEHLSATGRWNIDIHTECRMLDSAEIWEVVHGLNREFASSLFGDTVVPLYGSVNATCKYGYKGEPISYVCKRDANGTLQMEPIGVVQSCVREDTCSVDSLDDLVISPLEGTDCLDGTKDCETKASSVLVLSCPEYDFDPLFECRRVDQEMTWHPSSPQTCGDVFVDRACHTPPPFYPDMDCSEEDRDGFVYHPQKTVVCRCHQGFVPEGGFGATDHVATCENGAWRKPTNLTCNEVDYESDDFNTKVEIKDDGRYTLSLACKEERYMEPPYRNNLVALDFELSQNVELLHTPTFKCADGCKLTEMSLCSADERMTIIPEHDRYAADEMAQVSCNNGTTNSTGILKCLAADDYGNVNTWHEVTWLEVNWTRPDIFYYNVYRTTPTTTTTTTPDTTSAELTTTTELDTTEMFEPTTREQDTTTEKESTVKSTTEEPTTTEKRATINDFTTFFFEIDEIVTDDKATEKIFEKTATETTYSEDETTSWGALSSLFFTLDSDSSADTTTTTTEETKTLSYTMSTEEDTTEEGTTEEDTPKRKATKKEKPTTPLATATTPRTEKPTKKSTATPRTPPLRTVEQTEGRFRFFSAAGVDKWPTQPVKTPKRPIQPVTEPAELPELPRTLATLPVEVDPTTERNEIVAGAAVNDDDDETGTGNSLEPTTMLIFAISLLQAIHAFLQRQ